MTERDASEKLEIIKLVESSYLPAKQTLDRLGVPRTTFYRWYDRYLTRGEAGLKDRSGGGTDRLYLSQGHWLGLVLSQHNSGRLQPLHHRLETLHQHESRRRYRYVGASLAGIRL